MSINVMVVPVATPPHLETIEPDLEVLQGLVGGYIEGVSHNGHRAYVDEEGLLKRKPLNPTASLVLKREIVGTAVFIGNDDGPNETSVSDRTTIAVSVAAARNALAEQRRNPIDESIEILRAAGFQVIPPKPDARARVGRNHPDTSKAIEPRLSSAQGKVLHVLRTEGGKTDDELEQILRLTHQSVSAARRTLVVKGFARQTDKRRQTRSGNAAIVWEAVAR